MTATDKIAHLLNLVESGKTLYISTQTRVTKITRKDVAKFAKLGVALLKASGDSMMMASGNKFVCVDYCTFTVEG